MTMNIAERAEEARDLRRQLAGLDRDDEQEVVFRDTSPRRRKAVIYSMLDGERLEIPAHLLDATLKKVLPNGGGYMFTAHKDRAPEYKLGEIKCFLHPDAPERHVLQQIGLGGAYCPAKHLPNNWAKREHARHKHRQEWAAFQEHVRDQETAEYREEQRRQTDAMMALAGKAAPKAKTAEG